MIMTKSPVPHLIAALFAIAGTHKLNAAEPSMPFPDEAILSFMKSNGVPELTFQPGARLQRDLDAAWMKWNHRVIIDPVVARLKMDDKTREAAAQTLAEGIRQYRKTEDKDLDTDAKDVMNQCETLIKAGVDEPLVHWVYSVAVHSVTQDTRATRDAFSKAWKHKNFVKQPAALRAMIISSVGALKEGSKFSWRDVPKDGEVVTALLESLKDGSYRSDEEEIMDRNLWPAFNETRVSNGEATVREICDLPTNPAWLKLMCNGRYASAKAWLARGHSYASGVTKEGWKSFEEYRAIAVDHYQKAWKLNPERPVAARELLGITLTGGDTGAGPLTWLQRVQAAQFDSLSAFRSVMNGMLPRWGGTHEQMLAFGMACVMTKRFDTNVPYFFFDALDDVVKDIGEWRYVCRQPLVAQTTIALSKQRLQDAPNDDVRHHLQTMLGVYAWLCGDFKLATETLAKVPEPFDPDVRKSLTNFKGWNEEVIRGESIIFATGLKSQWDDAGKALAGKNVDVALKLYREITAKVDGVAAKLAKSRVSMIEFDQDFAKGEWMPLKVDPSLTGWQIQKGNWEGTADGSLVNRGAGNSAFIFHHGHVGLDFQMRGEFETTRSGLGIVIGYDTRSDGKEQWLTCVFDRDRLRVLDHYYSSGLENLKYGEQKKVSFLITCKQGKLSVEMNGRELLHEVQTLGYYAPHDPLSLGENGHVGFAHPQLDKGSVTKLLHAEVRMLPADFKSEHPMKPFHFEDTEWKRNDTTMRFASDGKWTQAKGAAQTLGRWFSIGDRSIGVTDPKKEVQSFHLSDTENELVRANGDKWQRVQK